MISWLSKNWFMIGIAAAVALGFAFPEIAAANPSGISSNIIVMLMFLGIGFTLPSEAITSGFANWRLHLFLQLFIFLVTPAYYLLATSLLEFPAEIRIGILALAVLPTTVSTCIVFTQAAGGNVVGTMFNAALSNVGGVFLSPVILSLVLRQGGTQMPMSVLTGIILSLLWKMVLPMAVGQLLHLKFSSFARANKKRIGRISNILILLIVLLSVAKSAGNPDFLQNAGNFGWAALFLGGSFYLLLMIAAISARLLGFGDRDMISIAYAAPQKTLAMGVPLVSAYFAGDPHLLGIALLPLLFYHPWQILNAGVISLLPFSRRVAAEDREASES
jgi:sodium/bile acid cotransporter 7